MLGIETATDLVGVAVADEDGACRAETWVSGRRRHAEALAPAIEQVLGQAGVALQAVTDLAVDVGPGLFTGLRVGVATAKGLAEGLGIGVLGCSSLEVLARAVLDDGGEGPVVAVVDARRGEVFAALYGRTHPSGTPPPSGEPLVELVAPALYRPSALADAMATWDRSPLRLVGDGARRYALQLGTVPGVVAAGRLASRPRPVALVTLAGERRAGGAVPVAATALAPLYLRQADARSHNWSERTRVVPGG